MHHRAMRRAGMAALTVILLTTASVLADQVPADGDAVTPGNQTVIDLGQAMVGQVITRSVDFHLTCAGTSHADAGTSIALDQGTVSSALDGSATASSTTIDVPADWPANGQLCPFPAPVAAATGPSTVTLTMPSVPGSSDLFTLTWDRTPSAGVSSFTIITFKVDVIPNTPPQLVLPADQTVEATSSAGASATFSVSATDNEDNPPPTPVCDHASGSTFALGTTTVSCTVTDLGGLSDSGSFHVTVADTTAPSLSGVPADSALTTSDPSGATLTYAAPTATDAVDSAPTVLCTPGSGTTIPVGTTTVTCTARDGAGNHTSATFQAVVTLVSSVTWSAAWGAPVGLGVDTFIANAGRTLPIKVEIFANGIERTSGRAVVSAASCGGAAIWSDALTWNGSRWVGALDTGRLGGAGCYRVTASLDGNAAGSFRLDLRGGASAAESSKAKP